MFYIKLGPKTRDFDVVKFDLYSENGDLRLFLPHGKKIEIISLLGDEGYFVRDWETDSDCNFVIYNSDNNHVWMFSHFNRTKFKRKINILY